MRLEIDYAGGLKTQITHTESGQKVFTDAPKDNGGEGLYVSPTDLLAASLASCMMTLMALYAKKHHLDLSGAKMSVDKTMMSSPRKVAKIQIYFSCALEVDDTQRLGLEKAALECPVHKSLDKDIVIESHFVWGRA